MSLRRRALLAATGIGLASRAWAQGAAPKPLRIGVLTDMSGPFSPNTGAASVAAARFAIEDFGGSVLGRKIELISADRQHRRRPSW